jgi:hypothetical protein
MTARGHLFSRGPLGPPGASSAAGSRAAFSCARACGRADVRSRSIVKFLSRLTPDSSVRANQVGTDQKRTITSLTAGELKYSSPAAISGVQVLIVGQIFWALEEAPPRVLQHDLFALPFKLLCFRGADIDERNANLRFVCSDMWKPYLKLIAQTKIASHATTKASMISTSPAARIVRVFLTRNTQVMAAGTKATKLKTGLICSKHGLKPSRPEPSM